VTPIPPDLLQALLDPTAPVPAGWPSGGWGAFLLFLFPVGGGIPVGVLMAQNGGVPAWGTAVLYFLSDVVLAFTAEPVLIFFRWLGRLVPPLGRVGAWLTRITAGVGLRDEGARGPLGLILVSFAVSPSTGRAAAAAAGHGFIPGWALAITGDMGYFALIMASTLWLSSVLGDQRLTIGLMLGVTWVLPLLLRRMRSGARAFGPAPAAAPIAVPAAAQRVMAARSTAPRRARRRRR